MTEVVHDMSEGEPRSNRRELDMTATEKRERENVQTTKTLFGIPRKKKTRKLRLARRRSRKEKKRRNATACWCASAWMVLLALQSLTLAG